MELVLCSKNDGGTKTQKSAWDFWIFCFWSVHHPMAMSVL